MEISWNLVIAAMPNLSSLSMIFDPDGEWMVGVTVALGLIAMLHDIVYC